VAVKALKVHYSVYFCMLSVYLRLSSGGKASSMAGWDGIRRSADAGER
jgi:hypothetical protein